MTNWRDESPARFGPFTHMDYAPFPFGGRIHFVQMTVEGDPYALTAPAAKAACGRKLPDWQNNPRAFPIGGVVDCPECLQACADAQAAT